MTTDDLKLYKTNVLKREDGKTEVVYYETVIVVFDDEEIVLNTGGWRTRSTQTRMNQISKAFKLGYRVFQKDSIWHIKYLNGNHPFESEKIRLDRTTGKVKPLS